MLTAFFRKDFRMDVDITSDIKKYTGRFCIALCILAGGIAYIMMQTDTNNHTTLIAEGRLMYRTENILSPSGGTVEDMTAQEGSFLEEGTVLAVVRNQITEEEILRLQKNVDLSKSNLAQLQNGIIGNTASSVRNTENNHELIEAQTRMERMKALYEMGAISAAKRDESIANYEVIKSASSYSSSSPIKITVDPNTVEAAKRQVQAAEETLKKAKEGTAASDIVSSYAGTITSLFVMPGDHVQTGEVLLQVRLAENPWIETEIIGEEIDRIYLGQPVEYQLDRMKLSGTVQEISDGETEGGGKRVVISVPSDITEVHGDTEHIKLHFIP